MTSTKQFKLEYHTSDKGKCDFLDWLKSLKNPKLAGRILGDLGKVQLGIFNNLKSVGDGIHELRLFYGAGYRVYMFFNGSEIIVILCGGDKSTQSRDVAKAKEIKRGYDNEKKKKS